MGLFDRISGIFSGAADFVTDFGGGIFSAVGERARGGTLRTTERADPGRRAGAAIGNLFGDIGESFITNRTAAGAAGTSQPISLVVRSAGGQNVVRAGASGRNVPTRTVQQAGLLPGLDEILTTGIGAVERAIGFDIPLLGPGSFTDPGGTQVADALPGGAPLVSVSGRASLVPMAGMARPRLPQQISFLAPTAAGGTRIVAYRNMGRPILWSGDLAAVKRVKRIARKVARSRPR